jgi:hypothetical protein
MDTGIHSANSLPSVTLGKLYIDSGFFAEYFLSVSPGTRQRKFAITTPNDGDTQQIGSLFANYLLD